VASEKLSAFEFRGAWGVCGKSSILYDASFTEATAKELARLENLPRPPKDWAAARRILVRTGFDVSVVEPHHDTEAARG
jgi:hypothetical protein